MRRAAFCRKERPAAPFGRRNAAPVLSGGAVLRRRFPAWVQRISAASAFLYWNWRKHGAAVFAFLSKKGLPPHFFGRGLRGVRTFAGGGRIRAFRREPLCRRFLAGGLRCVWAFRLRTVLRPDIPAERCASFAFSERGRNFRPLFSLERHPDRFSAAADFPAQKHKQNAAFSACGRRSAG